MNRRGLVVSGLVALVLVAVLMLWRHGTFGSATTSTQTAMGTAMTNAASAHGSSSAAGAARDGRLPSMLVDPAGHDRRIAGHVTFDGKPFAGAKVQLSAWGGMVVPPDSERTSGADGSFDFGPRPAISLDVTASAPQKLAATAKVRLADPTNVPNPEQVELVLGTCEAWLIGHVRDAAKGPIVHAHVRRDGIAGVDTDETGAYELCLPRGGAGVAVSADGYGAVFVQLSVQLRTRRDFVLTPEAMIKGIVVDDKGTPVPDAFVSVNPVEWSPERAMNFGVVSGADGTFRVDELLPGRWRLWATTDSATSDDGVEVVAGVGAQPDAIVRVHAHATIAGKVMRDGKPVGGVRVNAVRKSPSGRGMDGFSQEDGSFVIRLVPAGDVVISASNYHVKSPASVHVEAKPVTGVVVELDPLAKIKGRVTRKGVAVAGVDVCCVQTPDGGGGVKTRDDGTYEFAGVAPGNYQIYAQDQHAFGEPVKVAVTATEDHVVDIDLVHGAEIHGTVVDEHGKALGGLWVKFQHPTTGDLCRTVSDDTGRFECTAMTGGAKYAGAVFSSPALDVPLPTPTDKPYPAIDLPDGKTSIEGVTLTVIHNHGQIRGHVVDTKGSPIPDARVQANNEERFSSWLSLQAAVTDVDGNFTLDDLAEGSYFLQARSTDGGTGTAKSLVGGPPVTLVIALPGAVEGTLAGFDGTPVIYVTPLSGYNELDPGIVTGNHYRVAGLKPGHYMVNGQTTYEGDAKVVDVRAGETVTIDLTAKGRGSVDVAITDYATSAPVPDIQCHAVISVNGMQGLTNWDLAVIPRTDASGHLRLDPSPAGDIIVACVGTDESRSAPSGALALAAGANGKIALQSVHRTETSFGSTGLGFDWRVPAPRISEVAIKSSAAESGLAVGDLVVAVDDKSFGTVDWMGVWMLIQDHPLGAKFPITVVRGGQKFRVLLEMRPA
ncbi:MAG TPA: carboxypeptidase regulatory-like domain-containing protein [Kofleriaceae bacterium]|jgi:protocatechuate 3,4-dioxygenase beta subunit